MLNQYINKVLKYRIPSVRLNAPDVLQAMTSFGMRERPKDLYSTPLTEDDLPTLPSDIICEQFGLPTPPLPGQLDTQPAVKPTLEALSLEIVSESFEKRAGARFCPLTHYTTDSSQALKMLKAMERLLPKLSPSEGVKLMGMLPASYHRAILSSGAVPELIVSLLPESAGLERLLLPPAPKTPDTA